MDEKSRRNNVKYAVALAGGALFVFAPILVDLYALAVFPHIRYYILYVGTILAIEIGWFIHLHSTELRDRIDVYNYIVTREFREHRNLDALHEISTDYISVKGKYPDESAELITDCRTAFSKLKQDVVPVSLAGLECTRHRRVV